MALISFAGDGQHDWVAAGSRFRQVLDEAIARCSKDRDLVSALELAVRFGYLQIQDMDPALANRVRHAIREVARELMQPSHEEQGYVDEQLEASLRNSMSTLLEASDDA